MTAEELKAALAALGAEGAKAVAADEKIVAAAAERREVVEARLSEIRRKAPTDQALASEYTALIEERGQLDLVLGRGRGRS